MEDCIKVRFASFVLSTALSFSLSSYAQDLPLLPLDDGKVAVDRDGHNRSLPAPGADHISIRQQDGEWALTLRIASPGAAGLQLLIENLRLPQSSKLALYEADAHGVRGRLASEYQGVGPLQGDSFWTAPVTGAEALLEVTFAGDAAGNLPFSVSTLRHLTAAGLDALSAQPTEIPPANAELEGARGYTNFRGAVVPYEVRNGLAIFEGDIVIGSIEAIRPAAPPQKVGAPRQSMGVTNTYYRWTAGAVPYEIDPTIPNQVRITDAIAHWNAQLGGAINVRPRNGEADFVRFVNSTNAGTCSSYIGNVHMAGQAITLGSNCSTGNVIHELGHAIGLYHEHTREDRNTFVKINFDNIDPARVGNFEQQIAASDDLGAYDYGSIMHYPATGFSINGLPTIETIPAGIPIGQRSALSPGDIGGVRLMYPTGTPSSVSVTIGSNPSGRQLIVDGTTLTAPASFQWAPGSAHTVSAPHATLGSTRYLFRTWSDGGAQTHTVTVPTSSLTLTANFQKQHIVTVASSNNSLGTVANSPIAADSFYNEGSALTISAFPGSSSCFVGWVGVAAPAATPTTVTVNQPYSILGSFQTGTLSVSPTQLQLPPTGGTGAISVSANTGCPWKAVSNDSWLTITSGASGMGSGTVSFSVTKAKGKSGRTGTLTIGGNTVFVKQ